MRASMIWLCFVLLLVSLTCGQNAGNEEAKIMKHPLTDMPGAADDVQTASYFPDSPDLKLPIGEVVTSLCHFTNTGRSNYNISAIMGSLNAPFDFRHHYQNYSYKPFGIVLRPGEEITMKYTFQLHPDLEPIDYQLAITVFYDSETESFSNTYFNQTVELYLPTSEYDLETVTSVLFSLFATVFVIAATVFACFPDNKHVQKAAKFFQKSQGQSRAEDDWVVSPQAKRNRRKNEESEDDK